MLRKVPLYGKESATFQSRKWHFYFSVFISRYRDIQKGPGKSPVPCIMDSVYNRFIINLQKHQHRSGLANPGSDR